jgi:hypothetical protein
MSDTFNCPSCGRELRVPPELLGQQVRCPTCGTTFGTAPAAMAQPEPAIPLGRATAADEPPRPLLPDRGTTILVFGILSIIIGWGCIGLVLGPLAWTMGNNDLREIRAGRMDPRGEANTNAGRVCGIIGTILSVLGCCCWPTLAFRLGPPGRLHFR